MTLKDLLRENVDVDDEDVWENERTPTPVRCFAVRFHSIGLLVREVKAVLGWVGINRCYQSVCNWKEKLTETQPDQPTTTPSRVAVDEKQIKMDGEQKWLYAAIDTDAKLLVEVDVYTRRETDPRAAFLYGLTRTHNVSETEVPVDAGGYLLALPRRIERSAQLYRPAHTDNWFQTVTMRIDRFHSFWRGNPSSAKRWLRWFRY